MATTIDRVHRFTTDEYHRMAEMGILPAGPVELIDGRILMGGQPWRFSTEDYRRLAEAGILSNADRVELIEGEILDMAPIGSRHNAGVNRLARFLFRHLDDSVIIQVQGSIQLQGEIAPQPDVTILRGRDDYYADALPTPADVLLLVEVADTSLGYDRTEKADLYASAGVTEYWLADVERQRVFVHTGPTPSGYARVEIRDRGDTWTSTALPQLAVSGKDIFG